MSDFFADDQLIGLNNLVDGDTEFIPLISPEDEDRMNLEEVPEKLPILPLRNNVLFPGVVIPITLGRDKSIKLIQDAYKGNKIIGVVSQKDSSIEEPTYKDLYDIDTIDFVAEHERIAKHVYHPENDYFVLHHNHLYSQMYKLETTESRIDFFNKNKEKLEYFYSKQNGIKKDRLKDIIYDWPF